MYTGSRLDRLLPKMIHYPGLKHVCGECQRICAPAVAVVAELVRALYSLELYTILKVEGSNPGIAFFNARTRTN